jgi:Rieske Fe-S protein
VEEGNPCRVITDRGTVTAHDVIVATNLPILDRGGFFAKAFPRRHPVLAARIAPEKAPDGMFISTEEPSHSVRTQRHGDGMLLIAVGGGYKTGHADTEKVFRELEAFVRAHFDIGAIEYRWGNQDYDSMDRVPYVGKLTPGSKHIYAATGFGAWGMTNGTAAAVVLSDAILGRPNPWTGLYDATRVNPTASAKTFLGQNLDVAKVWVGGRLTTRPSVAPVNLAPGEGTVAKMNGEMLAVYKDEQGVLHAVSPVCTHMRCIVRWNSAERSWDCPCHGSRFNVDGTVIHGPAVRDLERKTGTGQ